MAMLKALVVDDASFVRDLVKRTVRQRFPVIETTDAQNGRRAQSLMSRTAFDLILCDWEMPEMSGLELLQWMRQQPQYENVPFIMITSRGDKDHVIEAVKGGVSEYLGKPFSPEGLSKKIIKVMGRKLKDAMDRSGKSMASPADAFKESANLLTRKPEAAAEVSAESPPSSPARAFGTDKADLGPGAHEPGLGTLRREHPEIGGQGYQSDGGAGDREAGPGIPGDSRPGGSGHRDRRGPDGEVERLRAPVAGGGQTPGHGLCQRYHSFCR